MKTILSPLKKWGPDKKSFFLKMPSGQKPILTKIQAEEQTKTNE